MMMKHFFRIPLLLGFSIILNACSGPDTLTENPEKSRTVDLTHDFSENTVYWVTAQEFELDTVFEGKTEKGYYYSAFNFSTAEHGGTHVDAPIHFAEGTQTVDEIPVEKLMGKAIKIDVSKKSLFDPDYQITVGDLTAWEK